jgi:chromosome transmission fidelity protein 8
LFDIFKFRNYLCAMTSLPLHTSAVASQPDSLDSNPLPRLLHTPAGLALLELQGTINLPQHDDEDSIAAGREGAGRETPIGKLVFPDYVAGEEGQAWMKRVYLYVGRHQRLTGEVKKLPRAVAIIRKRGGTGEEVGEMEGVEGQEELEIVEIIKFKILFSTRPEPVGTWAAEG